MNVFSPQEWRDNIRDKRSFSVLDQFVFGFVLLVAFFCVAIPIHLYGARTYSTLYHSFGAFRLNSLIGFIVILLGVLAALFKLKNQSFYGLVEFVVGSGSGFAVALGMSPERATPAQWASLLACAYVIARGLGNILDGGKTRQLAPTLPPIPIHKRPMPLPARGTDDSELDE
jgi:hypothetical protein